MGEMSECFYAAELRIQDTNLFWTPRYYFLQGTNIQHNPYIGHSISSIFQIQNFVYPGHSISGHYITRTLHIRTLHIRALHIRIFIYTVHSISSLIHRGHSYPGHSISGHYLSRTFHNPRHSISGHYISGFLYTVHLISNHIYIYRTFISRTLHIQDILYAGYLLSR